MLMGERALKSKKAIEKYLRVSGRLGVNEPVPPPIVVYSARKRRRHQASYQGGNGIPVPGTSKDFNSHEEPTATGDRVAPLP